MKLTKEQLLALSKCNTEFVSTMKLSEKVANCEKNILEILIYKVVILVILFFPFLMLSII